MPEEEEELKAATAICSLHVFTGLLAVGHQRFLAKCISGIKTADEMRHALMQTNVLID